MCQLHPSVPLAYFEDKFCKIFELQLKKKRLAEASIKILLIIS